MRDEVIKEWQYQTPIDEGNALGVTGLRIIG